MSIYDQMPSGSLERREMHLILFACFVIIVLACGLALFMYPVVFSQTALAASRTMSVGFFGFCVLSVLLALYLLDRQTTIAQLRKQIGEERRRASEALKEASAEILAALPNFRSFQDQLSMEYRRDAVSKESMTVLVITTKVHPAVSEPSQGLAVLGDAAKAISRRLREQDSIYLLAPGQFGVILPGVDTLSAQRVTSRIIEGLTDAAGVNTRFSFQVGAISYPEQAASARDMELAVVDLLPADVLEKAMTREALTASSK